MKRSGVLPDFVFLNGRGSAHALRDFLGDFTVLAFTHCDQTTHGPGTASLATMVAESRRVRDADVRGIDIHSSDVRCEQHDTCHLVHVQTYVLILCDATGAIRRLYGVGQEDSFFVIGPDHYVIDSGSVHDIARLRLQLNLDVAFFTKRAARARPRESSVASAGDTPPTAERGEDDTQCLPRGGASGL